MHGKTSANPCAKHILSKEHENEVVMCSCMVVKKINSYHKIKKKER